MSGKGEEMNGRRVYLCCVVAVDDDTLPYFTLAKEGWAVMAGLEMPRLPKTCQLAALRSSAGKISANSKTLSKNGSPTLKQDQDHGSSACFQVLRQLNCHLLHRSVASHGGNRK